MLFLLWDGFGRSGGGARKSRAPPPRFLMPKRPPANCGGRFGTQLYNSPKDTVAYIKLSKGYDEGARLFYGAGFYSLSPVADVRRTTGQLPQGGAYNKEFYKSRKHLLVLEEELKMR